MILTAIAVAIPLTAGIPMANAADQVANATDQTIGSGQVRASKLIGSTVYDVNNQKIGSVQDLILNKDGRAATAVVDVGSFLGVGGKNVAVSLNDIKTDNNRLTLDRSKQQLQNAPNYQLNDRNTGAGAGPSPVTGGQMGR
jgi:sporulation protein YlmC with PRC-barrel domain